MSEGAEMPRTLLLIHAKAVLATRARRSLASGLDGDFIVAFAGSHADGLLRLRSQSLARVSAIILSLDLPDCSRLAAFDSFRQIAPQCPILIVTDPAGELHAQLAVSRGAQDYILDEDLDNYRLAKAVRNMLERATLAEESFGDAERAEVTLNSIGDAVVSVDALAHVAFLNPAAQLLTGWS